MALHQGMDKKIWETKYDLTEFIFRLNIRYKLEDWLIKLGGVFSCVGTVKIWWVSDATLAPLH